MPAQEERLFISKLLFPAFRIPGLFPNCIGVVRTLHEPERPWQFLVKWSILHWIRGVGIDTMPA